MCRAFESHQACQKTASQSTVFDCGACFLLSALRGERTGASRIASGVPRRNELRLFRFLCYKNQSPAPLFLLFAKKSRSVRLLVCKRSRFASLSLPTFLRSPALHRNQPYLIAVLVFCCQPCEENAQRQDLQFAGGNAIINI